jgi:hypothetical protein
MTVCEVRSVREVPCITGLPHIPTIGVQNTGLCFKVKERKARIAFWDRHLGISMYDLLISFSRKVCLEGG